MTNLKTCKLFGNLLFTTSDGSLHHWVMTLMDTQYQVGGESAWHVLECSRYGWKMGDTYVGVLDERGNVGVWKEVFEDGNVLKSKLF